MVVECVPCRYVSPHYVKNRAWKISSIYSFGVCRQARVCDCYGKEDRTHPRSKPSTTHHAEHYLQGGRVECCRSSRTHPQPDIRNAPNPSKSGWPGAWSQSAVQSRTLPTHWIVQVQGRQLQDVIFHLHWPIDHSIIGQSRHRRRPRRQSPR